MVKKRPVSLRMNKKNKGVPIALLIFFVSFKDLYPKYNNIINVCNALKDNQIQGLIVSIL